MTADVRLALMSALWVVLGARFERWSKTMGIEPQGPHSKSSAAGFVAALGELTDTELGVLVARTPTEKFAGERSTWFTPTPVDLIDLARGVPTMDLALAHWLRGSPDFLDTAFGRLMRIAALETPEGRAVPVAAHFAVLQITDEFVLRRAYALAASWMRSHASIDAGARTALESLPPREAVEAVLRREPEAAAAERRAIEANPRFDVTPSGLEAIKAIDTLFNPRGSAGPSM